LHRLFFGEVREALVESLDGEELDGEGPEPKLPRLIQGWAGFANI